MDYCDVLSAVWTLILTAPIHCRASKSVFLVMQTSKESYILANIMGMFSEHSETSSNVLKMLDGHTTKT